MKGASQIAPFGLRMPEELKVKIAERAKKNGRSMNAEIVQMLQDALDKNTALARKMEEISFLNADDDRIKGLPFEAAFSDYIDRRTDEFKSKIIHDIIELVKNG